MADRITFTDDVLNVATASNSDATIRWHVYERPFSNGTSVYVQREVLGVLQAEVRLLAEGARPRIFFDAVNAEWLLIYNLQENAFMIRYAENEVPVTALPQVGDTAVDHISLKPGNPSAKTTQQYVDERSVGRGFIDGDNSPPTPDSIRIGAGPTPGTNFRIRFLPHANQSARIAGFNAYVRRLSDGGMQKANATLIPYAGTGVHEAVVPAIAGEWFVTQVNFKGDGTDTEEGRKRLPSDSVPGAGLDLEAAVEAFFHPTCGEGVVSKLEFVQAGVIFIPVPPDTYKDAMIGEGIHDAEVVTTSSPIVLEKPNDLYKDAHPGEGFNRKILLVGTGGVIIG